ncbi:heavy metal-(Cd/Co/Hg/Pb/Zn)-translocating P-type ATPase [Williamsia limnetica]|uniref:Heavy metal-(Cd/Co/Hg/Pb/Zn)-translocating P-type ATPase n=2 Tax=Williamsia limnetica TaxID=882452 RepID=A0A318RLM0_WILLI|nr:heavy metal-(Cd/Co/Hg/Pb/Zn)-translocating P-type ATPase [Williamsia limnetica]
MCGSLHDMNVLAPTNVATALAQRVRTPRFDRLWSVTEFRWATASLALCIAGGVAQLSGSAPWIWWTLYLACYAAGGWQPGLEGLQALRHRVLDVDLLMVVAAIGAAGIGQVFDGALLIVIFATSGALEAVATSRTANSVRGLLDLAPQQATLVTSDGAEARVSCRRLRVGDHILVRPGERIGADGHVIEGAGEVDQASITGEPMPERKGPGDNVFAGTLNGSGALRVEVGRDPSDTVMARIVAMVDAASATKATTQLFIEKFEQRYSVGVVVATLALFAIPLSFGADLQPTLLRAMTFMIVASPCAVVLATMPPLFSAIANAGRHGVLVKSAVVMEQLGSATVVAFDKTGTLTKGAPVVVDVVVDAGWPRDRVMTLAAAAEASSEHPVGRAIVAAARSSDIPIPSATAFLAHAGLGVTATVGDHRVEVSHPRRSLPETLRHAVSDAERKGHTAVLVSIDSAPRAVVALRDEVRADAATTVSRVKKLTGNDPILLTGDNVVAARDLAAAVGIVDVRAELLPHHKVEAVADAVEAGEQVVVVGDGVNDAPALAAAHCGIAMGGSGSDLTIDTADAIVVRDDLSAVPAVIALSRKARRVVFANLAIAAGFITFLVLWDVFGHLPLPLGVAGHEGSTIVVALNGLRLLRDKAWEDN